MFHSLPFHRVADELPEESRCPLTFMTEQVGFEQADSGLMVRNAPEVGDNCGDGDYDYDPPLPLR